MLLPNLGRIGNGNMNISASGRDGFGNSSVVDLSSLENSGTSELTLNFKPGGQILLPSLENLSSTTINLTGNLIPGGDGNVVLNRLKSFTGGRLTITGNRLCEMPALLAFDQSSIGLGVGGHWTLPSAIHT